MKTSADLHSITPQAEGWAVWRGGQRQHIVPTLLEAVELIPPDTRFEFAVPCHPLIIERLRLPATESDELTGMVQLQWEKALPFPPEEIGGGFVVLERTDTESVVWSAAAAQDAWKEFDDAWQASNRWPVRVAPHVCLVAAACPAKETVLVIYSEQRHWVLAVVENQRPGWVHVMSATDARGFAAEFPSLLLTAGLDGVPHEFSRVLLGPEIAACGPGLQAAVAAPVEPLPLVTPCAVAEIDLLPAIWQAALRGHRRGQIWRRRATLVAAVYLLIIGMGGLDLAVLHHRASALEAQLNAQRPALAALQSRQAHFNALAPAVDPHGYTVELLYLLQRCLPGETVRFTEFEQMPQQWRVVGEASSAGLAIDYLARLKHDPELSTNGISADPPRLLANERAQFQVIGKP